MDGRERLPTCSCAAGAAGKQRFATFGFCVFAACEAASAVAAVCEKKTQIQPRTIKSKPENRTAATTAVYLICAGSFVRTRLRVAVGMRAPKGKLWDFLEDDFARNFEHWRLEGRKHGVVLHWVNVLGSVSLWLGHRAGKINETEIETGSLKLSV